MKIHDLEKKYSTSLKVDGYNKDDYAIELGLLVAEARIRNGLTQKELAKKIGTKQPSIARIENGSSLASNTFLLKIAKALKIKFIVPRFDFETKISLEAKSTNDITAPSIPIDLTAQLSFIASINNKFYYKN